VLNIHYNYAAVLAISYNTCSCDATCHLLVAVQLLLNMLQSPLHTSIQQQLNLTRSEGRRNNRLGFTGWGRSCWRRWWTVQDQNECETQPFLHRTSNNLHWPHRYVCHSENGGNLLISYTFFIKFCFETSLDVWTCVIVKFNWNSVLR